MKRHRARVLLQHLLNGLQGDRISRAAAETSPARSADKNWRRLFGKPWCRGAAGSNLRVYKAHVNLGDRIHNHGNDLVSGRQGQQLVKLPRALDPDRATGLRASRVRCALYSLQWPRNPPRAFAPGLIETTRSRTWIRASDSSRTEIVPRLKHVPHDIVHATRIAFLNEGPSLDALLQPQRTPAISRLRSASLRTLRLKPSC